MQSAASRPKRLSEGNVSERLSCRIHAEATVGPSLSLRAQGIRGSLRTARLLVDERSRGRTRSGRGAGRGRTRRSRRAACADGEGVPRADGPRATTPALSTGGVVVHALAGAPRGARSARSSAARQRVVGGRSTIDCCGTGAKPSRSSAAWPESLHRKPCSSGWSSVHGRPGATGTGRTTRASWAATWSIGRSPKPRAPRSASS